MGISIDEQLRGGSPDLIVTGGSGGIGAATARLAAERGYSVCVNFLRQREAAAEVVRAIQGAGGRAISVQADIGSEPEVVQLFETVGPTKRSKPSSILIPCCSRFKPTYQGPRHHDFGPDHRRRLHVPR